MSVGSNVRSFNEWCTFHGNASHVSVFWIAKESFHMWFCWFLCFFIYVIFSFEPDSLSLSLSLSLSIYIYIYIYIYISLLSHCIVIKNLSCKRPHKRSKLRIIGFIWIILENVKWVSSERKSLGPWLQPLFEDEAWDRNGWFSFCW